MKHGRINLVLFCVFLFAAAVIGRLIYLQILNREFYSALAKGQQKFFGRTVEERGEIFLQDKDGNLLKVAMNKDWPLVYASPKELKQSEIPQVAEKLARAMNLSDASKEERGSGDSPEEFILKRLKKDSFYEMLKNKLNDEEAEKIKELQLPGIYLTKERLRYYPQGNFLSSSLGFVGADGVGQYGVENYWDDILRGEEKISETEAGIGRYLPFLEKDGGKGADLVLTIDHNIQYRAEEILKNAASVDSVLKIESGEIIVLEPNSGKIIAMADFPGFDPNFYSEAKDFGVFQNGAIQRLFEPGSVFKPITMAIALDQGKITPETTYTDNGFVKIGGRIIYNFGNKVWGKRTMTEVLEKSINTGAVFAANQVGYGVFLEYLKRFGIFERTGIDMAGEVFSQNKELKTGREINFATASFGQGIEMTPIQLARAFSAIANNGKLRTPFVVEKKIKNGKIIETEPEASSETVISSAAASALTEMLVSAVEKGFAKSAKINGYYIAGKTGTAQVSWAALGANRPDYSDKTVQSFIGFAPAYNPRFLILVKLMNPQTTTAEYSAAPLFRDLAKYIIDYWQIPPDYE